MRLDVVLTILFREHLWAVVRDWLTKASAAPPAAAFTLRLLVVELLLAVLRSFLVCCCFAL